MLVQCDAIEGAIAKNIIMTTLIKPQHRPPCWICLDNISVQRALVSHVEQLGLSISRSNFGLGHLVASLVDFGVCNPEQHSGYHCSRENAQAQTKA